MDVRSGLMVKKNVFKRILFRYFMKNGIKYPDSEHISFGKVGWVEGSRLTTKIIRHFYHLETTFQPDNWQQQADNHFFDLFWASLVSLPDLVASQNNCLPYAQTNSNTPFKKNCAILI